jgi:hypothetical protein
MLGFGLLLGATQTGVAQNLCQPNITFKEVRTSYYATHRTWTAVLAVDDSRCATNAGTLVLSLVRLKDTAPDLRFTEPAVWQAGQAEVAIDLGLDETISDFGVYRIAPCPCRGEAAK